MILEVNFNDRAQYLLHFVTIPQIGDVVEFNFGDEEADELGPYMVVSRVLRDELGGFTIKAINVDNSGTIFLPNLK